MENNTNALINGNAQVDYKSIVSNSVNIAFKSLCSRFPIYRDGYTISLNPYIMDDIINRCLKDFDRISRHHSKVHNPDVHKVAAYTSYMICKLRPVEILDYSVYDLCYSRFFIEVLACLSGLAVINTERTSRRGQGKIDYNDLSPMLQDFLYVMKYCNLNPDLLCILYYYIDKCSP